jgi:hypothetical protein
MISTQGSLLEPNPQTPLDGTLYCHRLTMIGYADGSWQDVGQKVGRLGKRKIRRLRALNGVADRSTYFRMVFAFQGLMAREEW